MDSYTKQTEKLTKAVLELNKRFDKAAKYQATKDNKDRGLMGSLMGALKAKATSKLRNMFSLKGVGEMMGFGQGTLIGDVLQARHDSKEEKRGEVEKARSFAKNRQKFDGSVDQGKTGVKEGVAIYMKQQDLLKKLKEMEDDIDQADKLGQGEAAKKFHEDNIKNVKKQLSDIGAGQKPSKEKSEKPDLSSLVEALIAKGDITGNAVKQMETDHGPMTDEQKGQLHAGIKQGMMEELVKANEEQVEQLKKLVAASEPSLEEKLEAKKPTGTGFVSKVVEKAKNGGSAMMDMVKNIFGMVTGVMKPGALIKGAAGLAAGAIGLPLVGKAISGGASLLKGATSGIGKLIGLGGSTVAKEGGEVAVKAGEKVVGKELAKTGAKGLGKSLLKKLPGIGLLAGIGFAASKMMDGDYVGAGLELASGAASTIPGIGTAASVAIDAGIAARDMGAFDSGETPTELSKVPETDREIQMATLAKNQKRLENTKTTADDPNMGSTTVVNNTNNSVNNVNKITKINAPVRNFDLSFNRRLDYALGIHTVGVRG